MRALGRGGGGGWLRCKPRVDLSSSCLEGALGQLISGNSFLLICVPILAGSQQSEGAGWQLLVRPLGVSGKSSVLLSPLFAS